LKDRAPHTSLDAVFQLLAQQPYSAITVTAAAASGTSNSFASSTPSSALPAGKVIHVILDTYATHKHGKVRP
jgi:hypothetical protein